MRITPYLESANKAIGYTIAAAAPEAARYASLARLAEDEAKDWIVCRQVHTSDGKLTFYSRELPAGEPYRDNAGRPIRRIDGICVAGDPEGKFVFHPHYLEEATRINDGYFEKFWMRTDSREGAAKVLEEIAFRPDLPRQAEGVVVREAYGTPKKHTEPREPTTPERSHTPPDACSQETMFPRKQTAAINRHNRVAGTSTAAEASTSGDAQSRGRGEGRQAVVKEPKYPTEERLEDQIGWYDRKSQTAQRRYKALKLAQVIIAGLIPLASVFPIPEPQFKWAAAALGLLVLIIEAVQQLNQHHQNWIAYRSTGEALKHEKYLYLAAAGPYGNVDNSGKRIALLADRIEGLISQEHAKWISAQEQALASDHAPARPASE